MTTSADVFALLGVSGGDGQAIEGVSAAGRPEPGTVSFFKVWGAAQAATAADHPDTVFIAPPEAPRAPNLIPVARPRLAFAMVVRDLLTPPRTPQVATSAAIAEDVELGAGCSVGEFAVIESGVVLGEDVVIDHHVVLRSGVSIGDRSRVGSHTSIGQAGFGFEVDADGVPIRIGHRGGVVIGSDVEIGSHVSIAQGTIEPTRISDHVKIDDCVFLAHNVQVGEATFVIAGAEVSGGVKIGARVWIAPEVTIINQATIGDGALVGIGAVVTRDVPEGMVAAGVPAKVRGPRARTGI